MRHGIAKLKRFSFANTLTYTGKAKAYYLLSFALVVTVIGLLINLRANNKFPYFFPFEMSLLYVLITSYYSVKKVTSFFSEKHPFSIHSSCEEVILVERNKHRRIAESNYNYILPIVFGVCISILASSILKIDLDFSVKLFCFSALACILAICAIGFTQYFYFILFLLRLACKSVKIKIYDNALPAKTAWLTDLASLANLYSILYFTVGLVFIILFYMYSFSDSFGQIFQLSASKIQLYILWGIIIVVIIIGFPITTLLGLYSLNRITRMLKLHEEDKLKEQRALVGNDLTLRTTIDSLLILLNSTPNIPEKPLIGYVCSAIIGIINLVASVQAVVLLVSPSV